MAVKTPAERAKEFLAGIPGLSDEQRQTALSTFEASPDALAAIGNGILRQDEFSRHKDQLTRQQSELNTLVEQNRAWYAENKPKVDRAIEILNAGGGDDDLPLDPAERRPPTVTPPTVPALTQEQIESRIAASEGGAMKFFGVLDNLRARHFQAFGEILDTSVLIDNPAIYQVGAAKLYDQTFADRYKAKAEAEQAKIVAEAEARGKAAGIAEFQSKLGAQGPYPTPHALAAMSPTIETLKAIQTETGGDPAKLAQRGFKNRFDEAAAAVEYQQLVAAGIGAGQT